MLLRNVVSGEYMRSVKNRVKLRLADLEVEFSERAQASLNQLPVLKLAYLVFCAAFASMVFTHFMKSSAIFSTVSLAAW